MATALREAQEIELATQFHPPARPGTAPMTPAEWNMIAQQSNVIAAAGVVLPKWIAKTGDHAKYVIAAILSKGRELGLQPMYSLEHVSMVNGKTMLSSQALLALIQSRHGRTAVTPIAFDKTKATFRFRDPAFPDWTPPDLTITIEMAKERGWTHFWDKEARKEKEQQSWKTQPDVMLRWRAISEGARLYFADTIAGIYLAGEVEGVPYKIEGENVEFDSEAFVAQMDDGRSVNTETGEIADAEFTEEPWGSTEAENRPVATAEAPKSTPSTTPATEDQLKAIRKLSEEVGKAVPDGLTSQSAGQLILTLSKEASAKKKSQPSQPSDLQKAIISESNRLGLPPPDFSEMNAEEQKTYLESLKATSKGSEEISTTAGATSEAVQDLAGRLSKDLGKSPNDILDAALTATGFNAELDDLSDAQRGQVAKVMLDLLK